MWCCCSYSAAPSKCHCDRSWYRLHNDIWLNLCGGTESSCLFSSVVSTWQAKANLAGWLTQGAQRGLVARLIGNGNNWPLGSICLMGGIGNQSYCLFGSIPSNSSMEASLSDALCLGCILLSDHTLLWTLVLALYICHKSVNNYKILTPAVFFKSIFLNVSLHPYPGTQQMENFLQPGQDVKIGWMEYLCFEMR